MTYVCHRKGVNSMVKIRNKRVIFIISSVLCMTLSIVAFNMYAFGQQINSSSIVRIFLEENQDQQPLVEQLEQVAGVTNVSLINQEQVASEFEEHFGQEWTGITALPNLIELSVIPSEASSVVTAVETLDGIDYISYQAEIISRVAQIGNLVSWVSGVLTLLAIFLLATSSLILLRGRKQACES